LNKAKTYGLTHLAIAVLDLDRTLNFYQKVFDMEIMYQEETMIQLTTPACNDIIVFEKKDSNLIGNSGGIAHFGFRLRDPNDIGELNDRIISAGGIIIERGEFVPGSPYIFFKDPDNYTVEIWFELLQET
jgi:catechol 2,3-dioxygenase-like lactoylglutathione lyase family enzyme